MFQSTPQLERAIDDVGRLIFDEKDYAGAWKALDAPLNAGHPEAFYYAGVMHHFGYGVPKDGAKAVDFYSRGSAAGSWYCVTNLGVCLRDGIGTQQNFAEARKCFQRAALQGNREAGWNLGAMLINGQGAKPDPVEGCAWYIATEHPEAMKQLPAVMARLSPAEQQQARTRAEQIRTQINANRPIGTARITLGDKPDGSIVITGVATGSNAAEAGVNVGDTLISVDKKPVQGLKADRAAALLDGPVGSSIQLELKTPSGGTAQSAFPRERK
jgi:hypothetical protein